MLVSVDVSVAAAWLLPDEASDAADQLVAQALAGAISMQAPGLWAWEVGNVLRMATVRKRITRSHWSTALRAMRNAAVHLEPAPGHDRFEHTLALAANTGLTFYDASYLEQAQRTQARLATLDAALLRAAKKLGVPCLSL
jgi:predicted nucleic acid-binding protein